VTDTLSLKGVSKYYGTGYASRRAKHDGVAAVRGVSLSVPEEGFVGLVGESGSGKSTIARLALGLERPDTGSVVVCGEDLSSLRGRALRSLRTRAQPVFQDPLASLNPRWTIGTSLTRPLRVQGLCGWASAQEAVATVLTQVDLPLDVTRRYPHQLSGGQRQRVCLARSIITRPRLIVADEPLTGLDVTTQQVILELLLSLRQEYGLSYLFISHDLRVVEQVSDQVAVMFEGEIVEVGATAQVFGAPSAPYTQRLLSSVIRPRYQFAR